MPTIQSAPVHIAPTLIQRAWRDIQLAGTRGDCRTDPVRRANT